MRREDAQLIARARRGDLAACFEAGRKYLAGLRGFPRHVPLALEYLQQIDAKHERDARRLIIDCLTLHEIAAHGRIPTLECAAIEGCTCAQLRLSVWLALTCVELSESERWMSRAATDGDESAMAAMAVPPCCADPEATAVARLKALIGIDGVGWSDLLVMAMDRALLAKEPRLLFRALALSLELDAAPDAILADKVYAALSFARSVDGLRVTLETKAIERMLDDCVDRGNAAAALMLGLALSGCDVGTLPWPSLVAAQNRRKASALLLRAADAGYGDAWTRLFELHANNQSSVANPPMARFFLEKAAGSGSVSAQRRLGAIILRGANSLREIEQGMHWLFLAAQAQDNAAYELLRTFRLPVEGPEAKAERGISELAQSNPGLAARLRVARDFGLTKLEAMTADLADGIRPWGLVIGRNPFIQHARLSAPRAIPALRASAMQALRRSAAHLAVVGVARNAPKDIELRHRAARLKLALDSHGLPESLYFAKATSGVLDTLRGGPRWARMSKSLLQAAIDDDEDPVH